MPEPFLLVEKREKICTICFNRPDRRNALSPTLLWQFADVLAAIQKEDQIRCLVIRGAGDKAFSAGYDISEIPTEEAQKKPEASKAPNPLQTGLQALLRFPYPVIAMINGAAYGAGCDLATACDIRIVSENARLSMPPAKLGIVYHWEGYLRFIQIVGVANAKEMFLTGRAYTAQRAKEMGLVNYVVPFDQLESFTYEMAGEIAANAPLSLSSGKKIMNLLLQYRPSDPETVKEMETLWKQAFNSEDIKEGQRAFKEKRKPIFKGK